MSIGPQYINPTRRELTLQDLIPAFDKAIETLERLDSHIAFVATLLDRALRVVKNVEAEGGDDSENLQDLIKQGDAVVLAILGENRLPPDQILADECTGEKGGLA